MKIILVLLSFLFISTKVFAVDGLLIKTTDYSFKEKWDNTLSETGPQISTCDTVYKKQNFFITAVAGAYALDKDSNSNVVYSIKITKPDNSTYFEQNNLPLSHAKISNKNNLQMSDAVLKINLEESDPLGVYQIVLNIIDKNSGETKTITSSICQAPTPNYDNYIVKDQDDLANWISHYYLNPSPEKALAYYLYYAKSPLAEKQERFWPIFNIFLEIAKNNSFILPQIYQSYQRQDLKTKTYLLYLLTYSKIITQDFIDSLQSDEKTLYLKIKDSPTPELYNDIIDPTQLDMLWSEFFASGSYKPVKKLIETLDYVKYQGSIAKFKESAKSSIDKQNAINEAIYKAVLFSLESNCRQHKLVKEYSSWALVYENLSSVQKAELKQVLQDIK